MAEYFVVPAAQANLAPIPDGLPDAKAVEPDRGSQ
jgi:threonine dehydrogenase-like Zn-dependent dehydrogenase